MIRSGLVLLILLSACCPTPSAPATAGPKPPDPVSRETALAAFETVRAVFQHPRCQNCHPAGDTPLQGDDSRVHTQNVQRGPTGTGVPGQECTSCHGAANLPASYGEHTPPGTTKPWHMPPPEMRMVFVGIAPGALCEQIKDPARNGGRDMAALRTHLDDPLVTWGWSPGVGRAAIPTPRTDFINAFELWRGAGAPCPN
jgi:hypothetical protein